MDKKEQSAKQVFLEYFKTIFLSVSITLIFITFVAQLTTVVGESMMPTFHNGEKLIVQKISKTFDRYDVILFNATKTDVYIKRVIGLPGETIKIENNTIYINGNPIDDVVNVEMEYYGIAEGEVTLGENEYFVMGDNRNNSMDSRYKEIGPVSSDKII